MEVLAHLRVNIAFSRLMKGYGELGGYIRFKYLYLRSEYRARVSAGH